MKPEQKFILSCRQTSEAAARLGDWLDHNSTLLGAGHSAVREDIEWISARLTPLAAAAETVPGIGLLASQGTSKTDLLFAILGARAPTTLGQFGQRPVDAATIRGLLPGSTGSTSCAILRFSCAEMPPAPRGYPMRIGLLSMTDIVAIIAGAAFSSAHPSSPVPSAERIDALFADIANRLSPQALPGLSERDVLDLRDGLNARWPGNAALTAVGASRYWDQFREVAPHLTDRDRRQVLAVLWNGNPAFSALLNRLCDGLDRLGQGADGYCPPEALLGKDKASGWLARHPRSIIDEATLLTLDQSSGPLLSMMNRYGQAVEIERCVVAGLISELPLHLGACRLNELAPAEVLDFPSAPAITSARPLTIVAANDDLTTNDLTTAVAHFARAKAIYLFERACQRRDVTSLVAVVDPAREDDTYAAAIGDWVETSQGGNAHARERVRRGFFVAAASPARPKRDEAANDEARIHYIVREVIGGQQQWATAWTPDRPLTEIFWFSSNDAATGPVTAPQTPAALVTAASQQGVQSSQRSESGVGQLVKSLMLSSDPRVKQLQLNQALSDLRRRLRHAVLRQHASSDPAALAQWRRGTAVVVQDRLQFIFENNKLGLLHRALIPAENDLIVPIRAAKMPGAAKGAGAFEAAGDSGVVYAPLPVSRMAEIAVSHWFKSMRRAARSDRLCRDLAIEPGVLHNLIDELQIGALRCGLSNEIVTAYAQAAPPVRDTAKPAEMGAAQRLAIAERECVRMAAFACRIISAYLEVLGNVSGRGRNAAAGTSRAQTRELEVADAPAASYGSQTARPWGGARRSTRPVQSQWDVSFVNLVEDNIATAHLLAGRGDKDRELGELIQLFAPGPFEVEP